ncbi:hypothetical protein [Tessaracoccus sp. G1721]
MIDRLTAYLMGLVTPFELTRDELGALTGRTGRRSDQVTARLSTYLDDVDRQVHRISTLVTVLSAVLTFLVLLLVFWLWGMVS